MALSEAALLHVPDKPFAYGVGPATLRVVIRAPAGAVSGGRVAFNDRYAWEGDDYAPLVRESSLWVYARDRDLEYWAADLDLRPPRLHYRFGLETGDGLRWFGWDGLRDEPSPTGAFQFPYIAEGDLPDSPAWARGATFYQIFPDRFARGTPAHRRGPVADWSSTVGRQTFLGGDLDGIVAKLDHLESLSVDAVYITPIFTSASNHKYDISDYFSVDPDFGGNPALQRLVDALHQRGMRLILDGVFNHAGSDWPPFVDVLRHRAESRYAGWFFLNEDGSSRLGYETWATEVATMPKLRTSDPEVRDLVCRIGRFWVQEYGVDGWRLDVASEVDHRLWRAFRSAVRQVQPEAFLVGEVWHPAMPWLRGDQFDSVMNYPFRAAILDFAGRGALDARGFLDAVDGVRAAYPEPIHGHLYNLIGSHDAERPLTACRGDRSAFTVASALLFSLPGSVSIYYGDEVGMEGTDDPGSRGGMVWDPARQDGRLLAIYRSLGLLRRRLPAMRSGDYTRLAEDGPLAVFARGSGADRLIVLANPGTDALAVSRRDLVGWLDGPPQLTDTFSYAGKSATLARGSVGLAPQSVALVSRAAAT